MKTFILLVLALEILPLCNGQDATALEEQYKSCAKHSIPSDKCTPEIYQQLKAKDNASLDTNTAAALKAVKEYQPRLKNPASMQLQKAYVTDEGAICLEIAGQNGFGGSSRFLALCISRKHGHIVEKESGTTKAAWVARCRPTSSTVMVPIRWITGAALASKENSVEEKGRCFREQT